MTGYLALATLEADGHLDVHWSPDVDDVPETPTVGTLGGWLRDQAPYLHDQLGAVALIADMDADGLHHPDHYTRIIATQQAITFTPADINAWTQALNPPSADSASSKPSPHNTDAVPSADSAPSVAPAPSADSDGEDGVSVMPPRRSFLDEQALEEPARQGWRGLLTSIGWRVAPGAAERAERADVQAVSQHWPGPRTIAIVNGKGGAGKTPTTIMLAAILARYGGAGVLAWDNNQTRGTLGWRTEQGPHDATVLDLLPHTDRLLGTGAQAADLAHYVHHQTSDRYDVLRSQPLELASSQRVNAEDVDAIHTVAAKYYRLILMDSGNDESDPMWQRMIDHTDQLVIATTTRNDHAEAGALLLEALNRRNPTGAELARHAVVIVSQADPGTKQTVVIKRVKRITDGFNGLVREVVTIPYDPALVGGRLQSTILKPATQRAWLHAAAAVARGL